VIKITYEFDLPGSGSIGWYKHWITVSGETVEDIKQRASSEAMRLNALRYMAIGLQNRKADWEAAFGAPVDSRYANYADTFK
jgi:hypothetical protein